MWKIMPQPKASFWKINISLSLYISWLCLLLFKKTIRCGTSWGWVNDDNVHFWLNYYCNSPQARSRSICLSSQSSTLSCIWCGLHYLGRTSMKPMSTYRTHICECPVFSLWAVRQQGLDVLKPWEGSGLWHEVQIRPHNPGVPTDDIYNVDELSHYSV